MRFKAFGCASVAAVMLGAALGASQGSGDQPAYSPLLAEMNGALRTAGLKNITIESAELLIAGSRFGDQATTLIASDRTHLLESQFVENDPRRPSPPNTITYLVDQSDGLALGYQGNQVVVLPNATTEPQLDAAMAVWGGMRCNGPEMSKVPDNGSDPDLIDGIVANDPGLIGTPLADITHAGWLPAAFFDAVAPDGSSYILGVTFTFVFTDDDGNATDLDGDGRADVAFREIYYNRSFPWGTGGDPRNVDIQSVAIHEAGHALGLAHFGKVFIKNNGTLQFAPKAIMNAVYVSEDRAIRGTDNASFCRIWANSH